MAPQRSSEEFKPFFIFSTLCRFKIKESILKLFLNVETLQNQVFIFRPTIKIRHNFVTVSLKINYNF